MAAPRADGLSLGRQRLGAGAGIEVAGRLKLRFPLVRKSSNLSLLQHSKRMGSWSTQGRHAGPWMFAKRSNL
jgi:hypothetical protein